MKKIIVIIVIGIILIALGVCLFGRKENAKEGSHLSTINVSRSTITNSVTATGTVEPEVSVSVGTQVSGIINRLYVDYNDVVKRGQLVAEMDKINLQAELESAQAQLASSKTEYEYQTKNFNRSKQLHAKKLISDTDYETALYNYEKAMNSYNMSKASMVKVNRNLEYATITSPIDGVVINRAVEEGQTVAAGFETPTLFTIAKDLTQMRVIADVDEADIGQVKVGQTATFNVDAYPNDVFEGVVTQVRLEATVTSNVVTYEVVISAPNPDLKLKPGLTANITIYTLKKENVQTIPNKSLRFIPDVEALEAIGYNVVSPEEKAPLGKRIVWSVRANRITPKIITVGDANTTSTEVIEGVEEGETLVVAISSAPMETATQKKETSPFMPTPPSKTKK